MYLQASIAEYLCSCAADSPTPGGGSVSALVAALGITMGEMAANFTIGREKFKELEPRVKEVLAVLEKQQEKAVRLMEEDSAAYRKVSDAYRLAHTTEREKTCRQGQVQQALKAAMAVPLEVVRSCLVVLKELDRLVELANPNLISDVGVSAVLVEAALRGAKLNVEVNLACLDDTSLVSKARTEVDACTRQGRELAERITARVESRMRRK